MLKKFPHHICSAITWQGKHLLWPPKPWWLLGRRKTVCEGIRTQLQGLGECHSHQVMELPTQQWTISFPPSPHCPSFLSHSAAFYQFLSPGLGHRFLFKDVQRERDDPVFTLWYTPRSQDYCWFDFMRRMNNGLHRPHNGTDLRKRMWEAESEEKNKQNGEGEDEMSLWAETSWSVCWLLHHTHASNYINYSIILQTLLKRF